MSQVVIENPILNSPYEEPGRHFRFSDEGITNEIVEARRVSSYFMPIPAAKKKGKQLQFDTEWTRDRVEENKFINRVRARVAQWRQGGHIGVTKTTAQLLEYWTRPDRERKLFFCKMEALETAIYLIVTPGITIRDRLRVLLPNDPQNAEAWGKGLTAPAFIVFCSKTNVSKLVDDYIAGWVKTRRILRC